MSEPYTPCRCVRFHRPHPHVVHRHHIVPKSWGGDSAPSNLVPLCPTSHEAVHRLLNAYVRYGHRPPWGIRISYNRYVRMLAELAWAGRPAKPTYTGPVLPPG